MVTLLLSFGVRALPFSRWSMKSIQPVDNPRCSHFVHSMGTSNNSLEQGIPLKVGKNQLLRSGMSMRFHPKRRASTDQAPGPSMARAAPTVANNTLVQMFPGSKKTFQISMTAASVPAMGVHKPAINSNPAPVVITDSTVRKIEGWLDSLAASRTINAIPATRRMSRRPAPGQPWANVE